MRRIENRLQHIQSRCVAQKPPQGVRYFCQVWTGYVMQRTGYGRIFLNGVARGVHRVVYELVHGPIPSGCYVLHKCDTPACCEPKHLFAGTQLDNMQDCSRKGRNKRTELAKRRIGLGNRGKKRTPEHRARMSLTAKAIWINRKNQGA